MDKNTITGFVLMALVLIGFSYYSRPTEEQIRAQHEADSIAVVQQQQAKQAEQARLEAEEKLLQQIAMDSTAGSA